MEPIADARGMLLAAICILALMIGFGLIPAAYAATRLQRQDHRPTGPYTMEEYNAEQAWGERQESEFASEVPRRVRFKISKFPAAPLRLSHRLQGLPDDAPGDEIR